MSYPSFSTERERCSDSAVPVCKAMAGDLIAWDVSDSNLPRNLYDNKWGSICR